MSILPDNYGDKYLNDYYAGNIEQGLGIGHRGLDDHLRFKRGQFVLINGLDNVGKTYWLMWYQAVLAIKHGLKWGIWSGENKPEKQKREIIEWVAGGKFRDLKVSQIREAKHKVNNHFKWCDIKKSYTHKDLFKIFEDLDIDGALIDPYTGLKRGYGHDDNYGFLNDTREFVNRTEKTLYVATHPQTEAARKVYPKGHDLVGFTMPPGKSDVEGGQPFASRPDDFITVHRLPNHPQHWPKTHVHVRKVKDTDSGGKQTFFEQPVEFDYNGGVGFTIDGYNPLTTAIKYEKQLELQPNTDFETDPDLSIF